MTWASLIDPLIHQPVPWISVTLAVFTAWLMGFSRSGIGAGGFVVSPLMVLALGGGNGLAVIAVLMVPAGLIGCWQHRRQVDRALLKPLMPAAILGTVLGGLVVWALVSSGEEATVHQRLEYVVAGLSLVYVALVSFREKIARWGGGGGPVTAPGAFVAGNLVAFSQTVANSGSPMLTIYFVRHGMEKTAFVAAQNFFLLAQNLLKLVPFALLGVLHPGNAGAALLLFPLTLFGSWCGNKFSAACSEKTFFALYVGLLVLGFIASILLLWGRANVFSVLG